MGKYTKYSKCIKCGNLNASTEFKNLEGDFIERICLNCGFLWIEETLDTPSLTKNN